jgi:hypothetical protein
MARKAVKFHMEEKCGIHHQARQGDPLLVYKGRRSSDSLGTLPYLLLLLVNETSSCSSFKLTDSYSLHILL